MPSSHLHKTFLCRHLREESLHPCTTLAHQKIISEQKGTAVPGNVLGAAKLSIRQGDWQLWGFKEQPCSPPHPHTTALSLSILLQGQVLEGQPVVFLGCLFYQVVSDTGGEVCWINLELRMEWMLSLLLLRTVLRCLPLITIWQILWLSTKIC